MEYVTTWEQAPSSHIFHFLHCFIIREYSQQESNLQLALRRTAMWVLRGIITQSEMLSNARFFGVRRRFIFGDKLSVLRCKYLFLLSGVRKVLETKHFADFFIRRFRFLVFIFFCGIIATSSMIKLFKKTQHTCHSQGFF